MTIKVGIIGCGGIANGKHMPSLQKVENVEMTAFCDVDISKAACAAKAYGTDNAKVYDDYKALLKDATIDVIHVCTPNDSHCEITVAGLHAGKHVMCEKPMAKTTAEAQKMIDTAKSTGKKLTIGYQNRFRPDSQFLYKSAQRGDLGDIYFGKAHAIRRRAVP
ncbi:Gfo/Idh/MocA family oxidoreductase, partial [Staphylococcus aureus]|nr:Gfo/Idh/MocA family oxidoreductase [Staphylococcus aureus]